MKASRSAKEDVIAMIQRLPADSTLEDIQYQLYVRVMVERGLKDVEEGRVVPHEEAKKRIAKWLKSRGLSSA